MSSLKYNNALKKEVEFLSKNQTVLQTALTY